MCMCVSVGGGGWGGGSLCADAKVSMSILSISVKFCVKLLFVYAWRWYYFYFHPLLLLSTKKRREAKKMIVIFRLENSIENRILNNPIIDATIAWKRTQSHQSMFLDGFPCVMVSFLGKLTLQIKMCVGCHNVFWKFLIWSSKFDCAYDNVAQLCRGTVVYVVQFFMLTAILNAYSFCTLAILRCVGEIIKPPCTSVTNYDSTSTIIMSIDFSFFLACKLYDVDIHTRKSLIDTLFACHIFQHVSVWAQHILLCAIEKKTQSHWSVPNFFPQTVQRLAFAMSALMSCQISVL